MRKPIRKARRHLTAKQFKRGRKKIDARRAQKYREQLTATAKVMNPIIKRNSINAANELWEEHKKTNKPITIMQIKKIAEARNANEEIIMQLILSKLDESKQPRDRKLLKNLTNALGKMLGFI